MRIFETEKNSSIQLEPDIKQELRETLVFYNAVQRTCRSEFEAYRLKIPLREKKTHAFY